MSNALNVNLSNNNSLLQVIGQNMRPNVRFDNGDSILDFEQSLYYNCDELLQKLQLSQNKSFTLLSFNCQSLNAKFNLIRIMLEFYINKSHPISCIALQETWLAQSDDISQFQIPEYTIVHKGKYCSSRGGLIMYVHNNFDFQELHISSKSKFWEDQYIQIKSKTKGESDIIISNIYRPPRELNIELTTFTEEITKFHTNLMKKHQNKKILACGDFNINLLAISHKPAYCDFFDQMMSCGLAPNINVPTRITKQSQTLIDNIYSNKIKNYDTQNNETGGVLLNNISDHEICLTFFDYQNQGLEKKYIEIDVIEKDADRKFKDKFHNQHLHAKLDQDVNSDPSTNFNMLTTEINVCRSTFYTKKRVKYNRRKHKYSQWITKGILNSINRKNKMYIQLMTIKDDDTKYNEIKSNLQNLKREIKKLIRKAKKNYYSASFAKYNSNIKETWKLLTNILNKNCNKHRNIYELIVNGNKITDKCELSNHFNSFFANVGEDTAKSITDLEDNYKTYLSNPCDKEFKFQNVTSHYVLGEINKMKVSSSTGEDGISSKTLKLLKDDLCEPIALITNQIINTSTIPTKMKIAKVIPIYKKGSRLELTNYRPISLLSVISKIVENTIAHQLSDHFNENDLFYNHQYGFRKEHSTELAALELTHKTVTLLENKHTPFNIYLDLSKAFDTINHDMLLHKLNHYGIKDDSSSYRLMENYLTDRKQYVYVNGYSSDLRDIKCGIPQGSVLGPLLFNIFINDIVTSSKLLNFLLYADDITLHGSLENIKSTNPDSSVDTSINHELDNILKWLNSNKLSINTSKTKFMLFYMHGKKIPTLHLSMKNSELTMVDSFNFLGVVLDKHMNWKPHIDYISTKLSKTVGLLSKMKYTLPGNILLMLYNTMVQSHLTYCILIWGKRTKRLFKIQKKAIRAISRSRYAAHTDPIFKKYKILKLDDLYSFNLYRLYYKLVNKAIPKYFVNIYESLKPKQIEYNLRRPKMQFPRFMHDYARKSAFYQLIALINNDAETSTPDLSIARQVETLTMKMFLSKAKEKLIIDYFQICNKLNCYSCNLP